MAEIVNYGNASVFNVPTDYSSGIRQAQSPVDRDKLIFGERNGSTEELVLEYDAKSKEKGQSVAEKSTRGIWNTPTSGLHPNKDVWRTPQEEAKLSTKARWKAFTSSTTFHGMRYIFEERHYSLRRILWIMCVLAAISAFVWQVVLRSIVFLEHHSNVNVQIIYSQDSKVPLPAVTLCNQNRYRVSATTLAGAYEFIDAYYSTKGLAAPNVASLEKTQFEEFAMLSAHQEDDLIEECAWQGQSCSPNTSTTFAKIFTDLGVCYTINSGYPSLNVTGAGSAMGLSLTLNVEQYEYMKGPSGDAGVKILLHDPQEVPLMKDLGFSVAPGTHTLAAIQRTEVHNLPEPYGGCLKGAAPMSECMAKEKTDFLTSKCGCGRPAYRNDTKDTTELCNFTVIFNCIEKYEGSSEGAAVGQDCPVPCDRNLYEASLSYAQLSKFNIEKFVLRDTPDRSAVVKNKLLNATETADRMDAASNLSNHEGIISIGDKLLRTLELLNRSATVYSSTEHMTLYYGVGDIAVQGADAVKSLIMRSKYTRLLLIKFSDALCYTAHVTNLGEETRLVEQMTSAWNDASFFQNLTDSCDLAGNHTLVDAYLRKELTFTSPYLNNVSSGDSIGPLDADMLTCLSDIEQLRSTVKLTIERNMTTYPNCTWFGHSYISTILQTNLSAFPYLYQSRMYIWYHETPIDPVKDIPEHVQCQTNLSVALSQNSLVEFDGVIGLYKDAVGSINYTSLRAYIGYIQARAAWVKLTQDNILGPLFTTCSWLKIYNFYLNARFYPDPFSQPEYVKFYDFRYIRLEQLTENFPQLKRQFDDTVNTLQQAVATYENVYDSWVKQLTGYKEHKLTKLELATFTTGLEAQKKLATFVNEMETYESSVRQLQNIASSICSDLTVFMQIYFDFRLPFLNNTMILTTDLMTKIFAKSTKPEAIVEVANLTQSHGLHTQNLVRISCEPFTDFMDHDRGQIDLAIDTLITDIETFKVDMNDFKDSVKVNTKFYLDNFLQVDIFYKEMSYQRIDQQVAFEALSLFSEVGGFMGLLLGASLLTLCELFDYLITSLCLRLQGPQDFGKPKTRV